jgi:hypothetical protein
MRFVGVVVQTALVACLLSLTDAFVPNKLNGGFTSFAALKASWKDLPIPELPPQAVNGVEFNSLQPFVEFTASLKRLNVPIDWSSLPPLPEQINPERLTNLVATFLSTEWQLEAIAVFAVGNLFYRWLNAPLDFSKAPFEPGTDTYSPAKSDAFYQERPGMVLKRLIKLGYLSGTFTTGLLFDWLILGKLLKDEEYTALKNAEPRRAKEALRLCEQLGPTFIKLVSLRFIE